MVFEEDAIKRLSKLSTEKLMARKQRWLKERERIEGTLMADEYIHLNEIDWCNQEIEAIDKVLKYREEHPEVERPG